MCIYMASHFQHMAPENASILAQPYSINLYIWSPQIKKKERKKKAEKGEKKEKSPN